MKKNKIIINIVTFLIVFFSCSFSTDKIYSKNTVLKLDGKNSFVELPPNMLDSLDNATIEGWFKWNSFNYFSQPFGYGSKWNILALNNELTSNNLQYFIYKNKNLRSVKINKILNLDEWYHIAAVSGLDGMKLYINGLLVAELDNNKSFSSIKNQENKFFLGKSHWDVNGFFDGEIDDVRIWKTARTAKEIKTNLFKNLKGNEENLFALWNFEESNSNDLTKNNNHGTNHNNVKFIFEETPKTSSVTNKITIIHGVVRDIDNAKITGAKVILKNLNGSKNIISESTTDENGKYKIYFMENENIKKNLYDLYASKGSLDKRIEKIKLKKGRSNNRDLIIIKKGIISGKVSDFTDKPLNLILVQLLKNSANKKKKSEIIQTVQTDNNGNYSFFNLEKGNYIVRVLLENDTIYYRNKEILTIKNKVHIINNDFTIAPQRKGIWKSYKYYDGLDNANITSIIKGPKGELYFATKSGAYIYNGDKFDYFPSENSIISKENISAMEIDSKGNYWFGTMMKGVFKYDKYGNFVKNYHKNNGLNFNEILSIKETVNNEIWVGTFKGLNKIDKFGKLITRNENNKQLASIYNIKSMITSADKSEVWLSSLNGLIHYSDGDFSLLNIKELYGIRIQSVEYDEINNIVYCGTLSNGLFKIDVDTKKVTRFSTKNGMISNHILDLFYSKTNETLWIATNKGVNKYKDNFFTSFDDNNGLVFNYASAIYYNSTEEYLLVGTEHGLSAYFDKGFQIFDKRDGLLNNTVHSFVIDEKDRLWIGSPNTITVLDNLNNTCEKFTSIQNIKAGYLSHYYNNKTVLFSDYSYGIIGISTDSLKTSFIIDEKDGIIGNIARSIGGIGEELWIGSANHGIFCYKKDDATKDQFKLERNILKNKIITCIVSNYRYNKTKKDSSNNWVAWAGSYNEGLFIFDSNNKIINLTTDDGLIHNSIDILYEDKATNTLWIGTPQGISCLNISTNKFFIPNGIDKLSRNMITSIYKQSNDIIWFGTRNSGLFGFDGEAWTHFDERDNIGNRITGIKEDKNKNLWISSDNGLAKLHDRKFRPEIKIISVTTDSLYLVLDKILPAKLGKRITVQVGMLNLITEKRNELFRWRIVENGKSFSDPNHNSLIEWTPNKIGKFTLEIQGIDKFLNYSDIVRVKFEVENFWYLNDWVFFPASIGIILLILLVIYFTIRFFIQKKISSDLRNDLFEKEKEKNIYLSDSLRELELAKKEAETEREKAEIANRVKSNFLANMSHEIRTPLNAVIGFGELLSDKYIDKKEISYVEAIKVAGKNLLTLINDILDLSKIETSKIDLKYNFVDPNIFLNEIKDIFSLKLNKRGLKLEVLIDPYLPQLINIDEARIRQVLINIVGNAIKFTYEGYIRITLTTIGKKGKTGKIDLQITVKDSGIGINDNIIGKIFDPFIQGDSKYTKNTGGTGLGLSICKKIITIMKGEISVSSKVGSGTTFKIILRGVKYSFDNNKMQKRRNVFKLDEMRFNKGSILIVDNDATNRYLLKELLFKVNLEVIFARDYKETISKATHFTPSVIMIDLKDKAIDGKRIAIDISNMKSKTNIHLFGVVTTLNHKEIEQYEKQGFEEFIYKPINIYNLIEKLSGIFDYSLQNSRVSSLSNNDNNKKMGGTLSFSLDEIICSIKKNLTKNEALKKNLITNLNPLLSELRKSGRMNKIKEFGKELKILSSKYSITYFEKTGLKLIELANVFDIEAVNEILDELINIFDNILEDK